MNVLIVGPYSVAMPFLVNDNMQAGVETLGLIYAIFPVGFVIGGVWLGRYHRLRRRGLLMYGATIAAALALGLYGLLPPLWVLLAAAIVNGIALELAILVWTNTLQELVPNDILGRVTSIDNMGSFALLPIGVLLAGSATQLFGAPFVFIAGGALTALVAALGLMIPAIRNLD